MISTCRLLPDKRGSHGTTWRTSRRSVEVSESQPIAGKFVQVRCPDLATEAAQIAETQVICYNDQEVGPFGFSVHVDVKRAWCTSASRTQRRGHTARLVKTEGKTTSIVTIKRSCLHSYTICKVYSGGVFPAWKGQPHLGDLQECCVLVAAAI